jgi:DNA-binding PadR family transcriptional regulator
MAFWHGGGQGGNFGWGWGGMRGGRRMKRGMLRWLILKLVAEGQRHGYDILKVLSERGWGGGPGSVYPLLNMLEEEGLIVGRDEGGKRVYDLTDEARQLLEERGPMFEEFVRENEGEQHANVVRDSARKLMGAVMQARGASNETRAKIAEILDNARKEVYGILANE